MLVGKLVHLYFCTRFPLHLFGYVGRRKCGVIYFRTHFEKTEHKAYALADWWEWLLQHFKVNITQPWMDVLLYLNDYPTYAWKNISYSQLSSLCPVYFILHVFSYCRIPSNGVVCFSTLWHGLHSIDSTTEFRHRFLKETCTKLFLNLCPEGICRLTN